MAEFNLANVWDNIAKKHNKHTSNVDSNAVLSCDYKKIKDGQTQTRKSKSDFKRFISYVVYTSGV